MAQYKYVGLARVTATLTGGADTLRRFVERASADKDGRVWLVDAEADALLLLDETRIADPDHWHDNVFQAGAECVEIHADADAPEQCGKLLTEALFSHFPGQPESGEAHFPVVVPAYACEGGRRGKVLVRQLDKSKMGTGAGGAVEYVTLHIDPADSAKGENWALT